MGPLSSYAANARDRVSGEPIHVVDDPFHIPMPGIGHLPEGHPSNLQASVIYPDGKLRLVPPGRVGQL